MMIFPPGEPLASHNLEQPLSGRGRDTSLPVQKFKMLPSWKPTWLLLVDLVRPWSLQSVLLHTLVSPPHLWHFPWYCLKPFFCSHNQRCHFFVTSCGWIGWTSLKPCCCCCCCCLCIFWGCGSCFTWGGFQVEVIAETLIWSLFVNFPKSKQLLDFTWLPIVGRSIELSDLLL